MLMISAMIHMWRKYFTDLYLIGKILLFLPFLFISAVYIIVAIITFFLIESWQLIIAALSKSASVKDTIDSMLYKG